MSEALLGVIIGGVLVTLSNFVVEALRPRGASKLDKEKRADDRRLASDQFQRETLMAVQDVATDLLRNAFVIHSVFKKNERETGSWGGGGLPSEVDRDTAVDLLRLDGLRSRVADQELRAAARELRNAVAAVAANANAEAADDRLKRVTDLGDRVVSRAGDLVRTTFDREGPAD